MSTSARSQPVARAAERQSSSGLPQQTGADSEDEGTFYNLRSGKLKHQTAHANPGAPVFLSAVTGQIAESPVRRTVIVCAPETPASAITTQPAFSPSPFLVKQLSHSSSHPIRVVDIDDDASETSDVTQEGEAITALSNPGQLSDHAFVAGKTVPASSQPSYAVVRNTSDTISPEYTDLTSGFPSLECTSRTAYVDVASICDHPVAQTSVTFTSLTVACSSVGQRYLVSNTSHAVSRNMRSSGSHREYGDDDERLRSRDHSPHHCVSLTDIKLSDSVLMPKQFTGRPAADGTRADPENWLLYFKRYCDYKRLDEPSRAVLFSVFLIDRAADWFLTLPEHTRNSYEALVQAFLENYGHTKEHYWKQAHDLFAKPQALDENVSEYLVRLRKAGERIHAGEEMINYAFLGGLRGPIRTYVLQQGCGGLEKSLAAARIAEASLSTDPLTSLLQEQIRVSQLVTGQ